MKRQILIGLLIAAIALLFPLAGCGYTTRSQLSSEYKAIYIENVVSEINVAAEQSNLRMYRGYRPGMEIDITKAVIDRFLSDGNLKIGQESTADIILKSRLIDFKRDALRYDANDNVEEYRIKLITNLELYNAKSGDLVWKENGFVGESTYRTSGSLAKTETQAVNDAIADLARRIVERTVEAW